MKKYLIAFAVALLLLALPITALAAEAVEGPEIPPELATDTEGVVAAGDGAENATEDENWFETAKEFVMENASGIIVSLFSLYMAFPKVGGIAALIAILRDVRLMMSALKKGIDDKSNPDSIGNKLSLQGDAWVRFMNDLAPKLDALEEGLAELKASRISAERQRAALLAVEEGVELMAKEFNDLISISTGISAKQKANMEEEFMVAKAHLHLAVKEALEGDEQVEKTTA
ncbi:MAG: hypothetical protein E7590_01000 [Ruminococcaceae bacterium]|nr:hypothetical protein [Oscillospiraceae bacterium]